MKTLLVLRHAQAVHFGDTSDHDRPLTEKGTQDAQRMGRLFRGIKPAQILCSTAKRAVHTAELAAQSAALSAKVQSLRRLYDSDVPEHLDILRNVGAAVDVLLIVGHNPVFEQLASALVHRPVTMKTGSLAIISLPVDQWGNLGESLPSSLVGLFYPAMLKRRIDDEE